MRDHTEGCVLFEFFGRVFLKIFGVFLSNFSRIYKHSILDFSVSFLSQKNFFRDRIYIYSESERAGVPPPAQAGTQADSDSQRTHRQRQRQAEQMGKSDLQSLLEFRKSLLFNIVLPYGFAILAKSANFAGFPGCGRTASKPASERPPADRQPTAISKTALNFSRRHTSCGAAKIII